ncbi:uncharacterized protein LOC128669225 isoform X2 [Plodia interpunctella]|uniref:uncharacterized protein LOC128669225 isoform X2 n=1 Tax=Plodia interpunctella TaxID=58824 RepID=UPI00236771EC|nr:uncharacterized protein LOC128669225 isoform X2 [Plodia interpunctella]
MDPVGPWSAYASYNRLAGVQAGAASGDFHHHLASGGSGLGSQSVPSTTSQLLLQAAHTTASLAGQLGSSTASPFNPGGFLSPPGYDAMFSPLFHHANPKPAHYSSSLQAQHRQVIAQAQAAVASKQSSVETELSSLRENYSHQTLAAQGTSFFDQSTTPGSTAGLSWQGNNQLPSPFGILPHESVVPSSPSPATTKASATYENFNAHFAAAQTLNNHLNSQLSSAAKQANRAGSPATASKPASSTTSTFFQSPSTFGNQTDNSYSTSSAKSGQLSSQQDYAGKQRANTASSVAPTSQQQNLNSTSQDATTKIMEKKFNVPVTGPGSGFMASYLKFLQGERDTSPPPAGRGARKSSTWSRSNTNSNNTNNKPYMPNEHNKCDSTTPQQSANGAMATSNVINSGMALSNPAMSSAASMSTAGLLGANQIHGAANLLSAQKGVELDDPRYYNLNKDRKRKYDGSEESAYDADEEARRLNKPVLNVPSTPLNDKGKKGRSTMHKPTPSAVVAPQPAAPKKPRPPAPPPVASLQAPHQQYYYQQQPDEATHGASLGYGLGYGAAENDNGGDRKLHHIKSHQQITSSGQIDNTRPIEDMPYQPGEFVAIKSELNEMWPAIWRVDGKTLLQKYEPFEENGKVLYRNISTYAAWNPENKKLYTQVNVKVRSQSHLETVVELIRNEASLDDCNFIEKRMLETQMYQENFEVYIQTLISHALDPNFLTEIFQEQDEYFLSNVKTVDEVTDRMRSRVSGGGGGGARALDAALGTFPGLSVAAGAGACRACARPAAARLLLYGQPYNPATLEPVQPDARLAYEKEFLVCGTCCGRVQLFSRISHQKYLMYAECSKRVTEKRMQNPNKDTTVILNELLADESWLLQLFRDVRHSWAEAESWDRKMRHAMSRQMI